MTCLIVCSCCSLLLTADFTKLSLSGSTSISNPGTRLDLGKVTVKSSKEVINWYIATVSSAMAHVLPWAPQLLKFLGGTNHLLLDCLNPDLGLGT
jgi:hypothetical protein